MDPSGQQHTTKGKDMIFTFAHMGTFTDAQAAHKISDVASAVSRHAVACSAAECTTAIDLVPRLIIDEEFNGYHIAAVGTPLLKAVSITRVEFRSGSPQIMRWASDAVDAGQCHISREVGHA